MDTRNADSDQRTDDGIDDETKRIDEALGLEVRALRAKRRWTQDDLAEKTGYNKKTIARLERGEKPMTMAQLYRICKAFGIRPSQLIDSAESEMSIE